MTLHEREKREHSPDISLSATSSEPGTTRVAPAERTPGRGLSILARRWFPLVVLITGLAVTWFAAHEHAKDSLEENRLRFEREVDNAQADIQARFHLYVAVLRAGAALFASQEVVTQEDFRTFAERLDLPNWYPGAQGFGFSLRLGETPAMPAAFPASPGVWPPVPRDEYHSIVFLEPRDRRNEAAIGFDMYSEPVRREAMARARDTASAAASGKVTLVQEIESRKQAGFLIYVPVYRSRMIPSTVSERRQLLQGFVYAPFRVEDAFNAILSDDHYRVLHLRVFDGAPTAANEMYRSSSPADGTYFTSREMPIAGRSWTIRYAATPAFSIGAERNITWWIVMIGIALSVVLSWAIRAEHVKRESAESAAFALSARGEELRSAYDDAERSRQRYRAILDTTQEAIWTCDENAITTFANEATARLLGRPAAEIIGSSIFTYVDDETAATMREKLLERRKQWSERYELRLGRRDGTVRQVRVSATPITGPDGTYSGTLKMMTDITSQRHAEQERDELNVRLERVLESMGEGLIAFDLELNCTLVNQSAVRLLGIDAAAAVGQDVRALLYGGKEPDASGFLHALDPTGAALHDGVFSGRNGTSFNAEYASAPILSEGEVAGFVLTFRDVTEQRQLRRQLEQAQRLSGLGRLAASIAHEFNNVLMVIQPFAEVIARRGVRPAELLRAQEQISNAIQRGKRSTEEILSFTREVEPQVDCLELAPYLRNLVEHLHPSVPDVRIDLALPDHPLYISGDAAQLQQVFANLILNARDADATTITVSAREFGAALSVAGANAGSVAPFIRIRIEDDGVGMAAEVTDRIFEPLFTTKHGGTGLGVPIAQQIVRKHGGAITVRSSEGKGTLFEITLPRATAPTVDEREAENRPALQPLRLLIVDDEESIAEGLSMLLECEGHEVMSVTSGDATLPAIQAFRPDVLILDVGLPDIDGRELYSMINVEWPLLPVIFSTGHAELAGPAGTSCLRKPFDLPELLHAVAKVVDAPMLESVSA